MKSYLKLPSKISSDVYLPSYKFVEEKVVNLKTCSIAEVCEMQKAMFI